MLRIFPLRFLAWLSAMAILCCSIASIVLTQGMPKPVSPRYTLYAIPAAIDMIRGHKHDYTSSMTTANFFVRSPEGNTDEQIRDALKSTTPNEGIWFVSGDDKGLIDLTYLSFEFFGSSLNSIVKSVILLTAFSSIVFLLQFWRSASALALLTTYLCGYYVVLFCIGLTHEAVTVAEPRYFGAICTLSSLHLMLLTANRQPITALSFVLAVFQLTLIVFVIHLRSSEVWQVAAIIAFAVISTALWQDWRRPITIILATLIGVAGLAIYKRIELHSHYFEKEVATRVLWHNALLGLAINPVLRAKYGFNPLDDASVTEAVRHNMIRNERTTEAAELFPSATYFAGNFYNFDWSSYEIEAKLFYTTILKDDALEVLRTYVWYVPKVFAENIAYLTHRAEVQGLTLDPGQVVSPGDRIGRDLFFTLFRPVAIFAVATAFFLLYRQRLDVIPLIAAATLLFCSLVPPILATPAVQYMLLPLQIGSTLAYVLFLLIASWGAQKAMSLRKPGHYLRGAVGESISSKPGVNNHILK